MEETEMKDDECQLKNSNSSQTSVNQMIQIGASNTESVKKRKGNRNSKPSKKLKCNRNSKASARQKANRNSRPSQKHKVNRNSKPCKKQKANRNCKPSRKNRKKSGPTLNCTNAENVEDGESNSYEFEDIYSMNIKMNLEEHLESADIYNALNERYFSTILQLWVPCSCCGSLHAESQLQKASSKHELEHDVVEGDLLCKKCIGFTASEYRPHCLFARVKNKLHICMTPDELKLGFMEQRAVTLSHVYMSIIVVRGHQAALKGQ
ncbi:unnamed protein product [Adineta ricciae]|uniref:Uncharacterized protein n=1 Tax=Adineta ricciae TaxID=249248 RepID=A0A815VEU5_ADIRI|nr:unnamed protein product [Adineta ricciae]CAF1531478.1 unnamed protein product [Adineta ricciae]